MFSDLPTLRTTLRKQLAPLLPEEWKIIDHLSTSTEQLVTCVYFEFTEVANEMGGRTLVAGHIAANFDVVVVVPETAAPAAEDAADQVALEMVHALERSEDLFWGPTAQKLRLPSGELGWRIPVSLLVSTTPEPLPTTETTEEP
ncbi:hypothetical protein QE392_001392 [Microbacterium proteolyticum]|uniref:hypothetical protein n=1 Tax=Microbacterium proteolyticum TaxID=1572644 RepID=UPI002788DE9D|nr:hypothetical protein [Microbacterium proteolyticum]MDQ1169588.1 hypothetical protein [Microbacterium proteolyticum]